MCSRCCFLKNQSIALGKGPEFIYQQAKAVYDNGKAIPPQPAIERRRTQLGLEPVFCDVDPYTQHMSIENIESLIDPEVEAIMGVNLWGGSCDVYAGVGDDG